MRPFVSLFLFAALLLFVGPTHGKNAAAFCKCICGSESQIIALNPPEEDVEASNNDGLVRRFFRPVVDINRLGAMRRRDDEEKEKEGDKQDDGKDATKRQKTCNDCNRQFCLDYNLPKCKTLPAEEVTTDCFKRDSSKDQAVVLIFIAATVSLLGWALLRPWVGKFLQNARDRSLYTPVAGDGE